MHAKSVTNLGYWEEQVKLTETLMEKCVRLASLFVKCQTWFLIYIYIFLFDRFLIFYLFVTRAFAIDKPNHIFGKNIS
jgi:hypothetical protein